jgi:hypothetical protein
MYDGSPYVVNSLIGMLLHFYILGVVVSLLPQVYLLCYTLLIALILTSSEPDGKEIYNSARGKECYCADHQSGQDLGNTDLRSTIDDRSRCGIFYPIYMAAIIQSCDHGKAGQIFDNWLSSVFRCPSLQRRLSD